MKTILLAAATLLTAITPSLVAQTITGNCPQNGFQTWSEMNLTNDGAPFWDSYSLDGNIGLCLSGTPLCTHGLEKPPGAIPFWGKSFDSANDRGGASDRRVFFSGTGLSPYLAVLQAENGDFASAEEFGWFETDQDGSSIGSLQLLLRGSDPIGTSVAFTPTTFYGFYMVTFDGEIFYTLSDQNPTDKRIQHFAVFSSLPGSSQSVFWFGLEDGPGGGDRDYNDIIISIHR